MAAPRTASMPMMTRKIVLMVFVSEYRHNPPEIHDWRQITGLFTERRPIAETDLDAGFNLFRIICLRQIAAAPAGAQACPFDFAHPFDGFDRLTAGRLRMTLSGVEWVRAPGVPAVSLSNPLRGCALF